MRTFTILIAGFCLGVVAMSALFLFVEWSHIAAAFQAAELMCESCLHLEQDI